MKIVYPRIDYNKYVGLHECYDVRLVDMFDAEEITEGKRVLISMA